MARNIRRNFSGILIGPSASAKVGFFGTAPITQPTSASQGTLTHSVGSADGTVDDVGAAFSQATLNNNFKECTSRINALRDALANLGLIKGS